MAGSTLFVVATLSAALVADVSRVSAQDSPVDFVAGIATTETSAEHKTLAIARVEARTSRAVFRDGWNIRADARAGWQPLFTMRDTTPEYREGLSVAAGFRLAHTTARLETALVGHIGSTRLDEGNTVSWAAFFEGGVDFQWLVPLVDVYAGLRHDNRLGRTGALSNYRDPTGRVLLAVSVFPLRFGRVAAGVSLESESALPGAGRLPAGVAIAALIRY